MDQALEKRFLTRVVKDVTAATQAAQRGVSYDFFVWKTAGTLYRVVSWYSTTYGTLLGSVELEELLQQSTTIPEDLQKSVFTLFQELQLLPVEEIDLNFLIDQLFSYNKQNLVEDALRKSVELLSEKKLDKAVTVLKNDLAKIDQKFTQEIVRSGTLDTDADKLIFEYHDRKANPDKYKGIHLGFSGIDSVTGGLKPGTVSLLLGPPKGFKSALALNVAYNVAQQGKFVYYFANEGTRELFHARYAAKTLGIPLSHITDNRMTTIEEQQYLDFYNDVKLGKHPVLNNIYFDEIPMTISTPSFLANKIKKLREEDSKQVGFIIIDHFGRMSPSEKGVTQKWEKGGIVAQELCGLALQERLVLFALAHPNLGGIKDAKEEGKDIEPEDLGLSSQPIKDIDYMFSWVLENMETFKQNGNKGFGRLALKLSRHSQEAVSTLMVEGSLMRINEIVIGNSPMSTVSSPSIP